MLHRNSVFVATAALAICASAPACAQDETSERFDDFIEQVRRLELAPGLAVAVVQGDEVIYLKGFGYADVAHGRKVTPETVFYIASSTKSFTGTAVAILDVRGELDLDATLADYLPQARLQEPLDPSEITLRDLLTHTHGILNYGPVTFRSAYSGAAPHEQMVELLYAHGAAEDGRAFQYSNIGYNVASLAMDEELRMGWKDVLAREIFEPLGMSNTTGYVSRVPHDELALPYSIEAVGFIERHYAKSDENMHAAGGLVTTVADLARWLEVNLNDGRLDGEQVIPAEAIREAQRPQAEQDAEFMKFKRTGYGLGWNTGSYEGDPFVHHFGGFSGFHSHISFMPEHDIGVAVLANDAFLGSRMADVVARYIYDTLLAKEGVADKYALELVELSDGAAEMREQVAADRSRRAARPQTLSHPLYAYAGVYENPAIGSVEFKVVGDALEATMGPLWSAVEVYDHTKDALRIELAGGGSVVVFEFGDGQRAESITAMGTKFTRVN